MSSRLSPLYSFIPASSFFAKALISPARARSLTLPLRWSVCHYQPHTEAWREPSIMRDVYSTTPFSVPFW